MSEVPNELLSEHLALERPFVPTDALFPESIVGKRAADHDRKHAGRKPDSFRLSHDFSHAVQRFGILDKVLGDENHHSRGVCTLPVN